MMPAEKLVSQSAAGEAAAPAAASFAPGVKSMTGGGNLGFGAQEYLQSDPGIADVVPQNELNPYPGEFMGDLSDPYSDARLKSPTYGDDQAAQDFIHTLKPHTYNWKDPGHAPNPEAARQPNLGVYAQDIEKSPWGQAIVQDDGRGGAKTLDHKALMSALAAGLGHTAKKQDEHERRLSLLEMALTGGR
jgi:hypothetical protein